MLLDLYEMYEILMQFFVIVSRLVLAPIQYVGKNNNPKKATKLIIARAEPLEPVSSLLMELRFFANLAICQ